MSNTVTIFCETRDLGSGILASALVTTDVSTIRLYGAAFRADGAGEQWIPSVSRLVGCTNGLTRDFFDANVAAKQWFAEVEAEIWRRAHPSSTPTLPASEGA